MRLEHFERSRRDNVLSLAATLGICYDMNYLPFWWRWYYLWRFRKRRPCVHLMPRFFSLERAMEHYDCRRHGDIYLLGDMLEIKVDYLDDGNLVFEVSDMRKYAGSRNRNFLARVGDQEADVIYCLELDAFMAADQVAEILEHLCALKEEHDEWKYYEGSY